MNFKNPFSVRHKYQIPSTAIIKDSLPQEINNAIENTLLVLWEDLDKIKYEHYNYGHSEITQYDVEKELWIHFLNGRLEDFSINSREYRIASADVLTGGYSWFIRLDMIEYIIKYIKEVCELNNYARSLQILDVFIQRLNFEFKRLNYAYRVIGEEIVEVNADEQIEAIQLALDQSKDNVREHICKALEHYAQRPQPDIRNSIKESISAVEAVCRDLTGETTLGKALNKLEDNGIQIHSMLKESFKKLYVYTNDEKTGIRHALMDADAGYVPTADEAYFMLVACSTFVNYLRSKVANP